MCLSEEECERVLGERFFGFGRWNAPYWFIGPEQGQHKNENGRLTPRCEAFLELEQDGLCDCKDFHERVGIPATLRWYRSPNVPLQNTWRRLMRTLHAYKSDRAFSNEDLRAYQEKLLGRSSEIGETCIVELCGIPSHSFAEDIDRETYLLSRLERLANKLTEQSPAFVVIHGKRYQELWKDKLREIGGQIGAHGVWSLGQTRIGFIDTRRGQPNHEWDDLGRTLRA